MARVEDNSRSVSRSGARDGDEASWRPDPVMTALAEHDRAVAALGRPIWLGAEPTYTDAASEAREWLCEALDDEKYSRAQRMLGRLVRSFPGASLLRSVGRQYAGEPLPRWCLGLYARRDGVPVWTGPPDPLLTEPVTRSSSPARLARVLAAELGSRGFAATLLRVDAPLPARVIFRTDGLAPPHDPSAEPRLARPSVHGQHLEGVECRDTLAEAGNFLIACGLEGGSVRVELPAFDDVALFQVLLAALSRAAYDAATPALVIGGYPPPVDETVAWTTLTPDPAVVEVNMAPEASVAALLLRLRELQLAAQAAGLSPWRLQYNGAESDSGGAGHVTLGGPCAALSPFFITPTLLPSLVRYFNRHPSLSYWFARDSAGADSQAPRADERPRPSFLELGLTLELLAREGDLSPETLSAALAPFLADLSGNTHRAELNIEKLWNPGLGARGRQGLVEFRGLGMAPSPEKTAAIAALLRAVLAMLAEHPLHAPLIDWGDTLHERFSLPFFLERDLREVLGELESRHLGLRDSLTRLILEDRHRLLATRTLCDCRVELRRAIEFWPLVGDTVAQESGGFRLVDASTARVEVRLRPRTQADDIRAWTLVAAGWNVPLQDDCNERGPLRIVGLRYRSFEPARGLHPTLRTQAPLALLLTHPTHGTWRITLHEWPPDGGPYPGLPRHFEEARSRRDERCVVELLSEAAPRFPPAPPAAPGGCVVDLRWQ